jgi:hypothetical protein
MRPPVNPPGLDPRNRSLRYRPYQAEKVGKAPPRVPFEPIVYESDGEEPLEIEEHVDDPFRHYYPALFRWDDSNFRVGPEFFVSTKALKSFGMPYLNEPLRRARVLKKLEKGTLGLAIPENYEIEKDMPDDLREFIEQNTVKPPPPPPVEPPYKSRRKNPT